MTITLMSSPLENSRMPEGFPGGSVGKESACSAADWVQFLGWEDPLEKGTATHFSVLAWRIPWTEEPDGLQSMESQSQKGLRDFQFP